MQFKTEKCCKTFRTLILRMGMSEVTLNFKLIKFTAVMWLNNRVISVSINEVVFSCYWANVALFYSAAVFVGAR